MTNDVVAPASNPREIIERLIAAGEHVEALAAARSYWRAGPEASVARFLKSRIEQCWPRGEFQTNRLAILRSFTLEPVIPFLQVEAALGGRRVETWIGEYGAYGQEILDPTSGLYAFGPDTIIVAVQTRDVSPALWSEFSDLSDGDVEEEVDAAAGTMIQLLSRLRASVNANIIVHGLERPLFASEGLLGLRRKVGQAAAIEAVSQRLRQWTACVQNAHFLDYDDLQARHGRERFVDEKKWATAKLPLSVHALGWLAAEWWRHLAILSLPPAKVLVLDLDNTLWGGVVGEDGIAGVKLGDEYPGGFYKRFQRAICDVARRGVLLAIASKNNRADALQVIDEHPDMLLRSDQFAAMRIDWQPKAANIVAMAEELNLGIDSFIFVDDNPAECEAVRRALPQVEVIELPADPSVYANLLRQSPRLERLSISAEDADRGRYYAVERQRRQSLEVAESLDGFLHSLRIEVNVAPIDAMSIGRAAQLTQKTNQLNMTTRRYGEVQLDARLKEPGWAGYTLRAADRFGDNGIVGVALVQTRNGVCEIDTFLMSCRVIGRQIETAFLTALSEIGRQEGARELRGWFIPTAKNAPAAGIYAQAGLEVCETRDGAECWRIDLLRAPTTPAWIALRMPALTAGEEGL
ncbi:MAG: HAD family hydrolase [Phenylobacterium sp.]|nr:HAD family hydrolase [Phenylobacterium sp.]